MHKKTEISKEQMRDTFINALMKKALLDRDIIFISNEMGAESLDQFRKDLPGQFINAGISEQNIISVAAGMALEGKKVFVYSIASFISLRCLEQVKIDICSMKLPVTIIGVGASYSYSTDGPTHHATEDISVFRSMPGMRIICPADSFVAGRMVEYALKSKGPLYIRFDREKTPVFYSGKDDLSKGYKVIHQGKDICLISTGIMTHKAYGVACRLEESGIGLKVIDLFAIKPINTRGILDEIKDCSSLITLEEHALNGGVGSIFSELLHDNRLNIELIRCGIKEKNIFSYRLRDDVHKINNIDTESLIKMISKIK